LKILIIEAYQYIKLMNIQKRSKVLCTLYSVLCTLYSVLCTLYSILYTLYSVLCTLYSVLLCTPLLRLWGKWFTLWLQILRNRFDSYIIFYEFTNYPYNNYPLIVVSGRDILGFKFYIAVEWRRVGGEGWVWVAVAKK
jgi:hypothetical protein